MAFIGDFQREMKRQSGRRRCLHFDKGEHCNEFIAAHSIQKSGQLKSIAEDGHVYRLSADYSILKSTGGIPTPKKIGVNHASTFAGFCKYHDNELFKPIDQEALAPNHKQIALYAYRCVCREFFVKVNAVRAMENLQNHSSLAPYARDYLHSSLKGHGLGLEGLKYHKEKFEKSIKANEQYDFEHILFTSTSACPLQMSGLLYPDFTFTGEKLQNLGNWDFPLDLITFFTAPTADGWGFGFAWHVTSQKTCEAFVRSLGSFVAHGGKLEDALLRFSFSCCENHAFRISWWDKLPDESKTALIHRMCLMAAPNIPVPQGYLTQGCEGIADWNFGYVLTNQR